MRSKYLAPFFLIAALAWPTQARAHGPDNVDGLIALGVLGGLGGATIVVGGAVTGLHNGVVAGQGEQLTSGWRSAGYAFAGLNLAGSAAWLTAGITTGVNGDASMRNLSLGFAAVQGVIGGLGLGMTLWGARTPESRITLVPAAIEDARGRLAPGIGVAGVLF